MNKRREILKKENDISGNHKNLQLSEDCARLTMEEIGCKGKQNAYTEAPYEWNYRVTETLIERRQIQEPTTLNTEIWEAAEQL